jgi:hypothetical protein
MSIPARPTASHPGAALEPTGNPMKDGMGAAAWATDRADRPDLTHDGRPRIQPMSTLNGFTIESRDPDPRGMKVVGADGVVAGVVTDLWIDLAEPQIRFLTLELPEEAGSVLVPMGFVKIKRPGRSPGPGTPCGALRRHPASEGGRPDHPPGGGSDLRLLRRWLPLRGSVTTRTPVLTWEPRPHRGPIRKRLGLASPEWRNPSPPGNPSSGRDAPM